MHMRDISQMEVVSIRFPRTTCLEPQLMDAVDRLGDASAKAQRLNVPVTNFGKLSKATDVTVVYLIRKEKRYVGLLKISRKLLYFHDGESVMKFSPICVLDFYVHDKREGLGTALFEAMLIDQNVDCSEIAFDRPSPSMISFLTKRMGIRNLCMQGNKFSISAEFFASQKTLSEFQQCNERILRI